MVLLFPYIKHRMNKYRCDGLGAARTKQMLVAPRGDKRLENIE